MKRWWLLGLLVFLVAACGDQTDQNTLMRQGVTVLPSAPPLRTPQPTLPAPPATIAPAPPTLITEPVTPPTVDAATATRLVLPDPSATPAPATPTPPPTATPAASPPRLPAVTPAPAQAVYPIVDPQSGFLLGGVRNQQWLEDAAMAPLLTGAEMYRFYTERASTGVAQGSLPRPVDPPCVDLNEIVFAGGSQAALIALAGEWNALPRSAEDLSIGTPEYRTAIDQVLRAQGLAEPTIQLSRVLRTDLDNDGIYEVLIAATHLANGVNTPAVESGDYSVVILRSLVKDRVETTIIEINVYPVAEAFVGPNEFTLRGIADLNGDGHMEILVDSRYYEGSGLSIYAVRGSRAEPVLSVGCGA